MYPAAYQAHLLERLARDHDLVGYVLVSEPPAPRLERYRRLLGRAGGLSPLWAHYQARKSNRAAEKDVRALHERLFFLDGREPRFPKGCERLDVGDVNAAGATRLVAKLAPDIVLVNGTNLLRTPMLTAAETAPLGVVNVHTGLSPYTRGGSCNLWAILERQIQCVGVTVHRIDAGIDSGEIILSGRPSIESCDTFESLEEKTFRLGFDLALEAIQDLASGDALAVPQWEPGRLFLRKTGYHYRPGLRSEANRILQDERLIETYLRHRKKYDEGVRLVTSVRSRAACPPEGFAQC